MPSSALWAVMKPPPSPAAHRLADPEGHRALEDIALHRQLRVLLPQPLQLRPLVLTQRPVALTPGTAILGTPVAQRSLVDPELAGHLRDRLARLPHDAHRTDLEVLIELPTCLCHRLPPQRRCLHAKGGSPRQVFASAGRVVAW